MTWETFWRSNYECTLNFNHFLTLKTNDGYYYLCSTHQDQDSPLFKSTKDIDFSYFHLKPVKVLDDLVIAGMDERLACMILSYFQTNHSLVIYNYKGFMLPALGTNPLYIEFSSRCKYIPNLLSFNCLPRLKQLNLTHFDEELTLQFIKNAENVENLCIYGLMTFQQKYKEELFELIKKKKYGQISVELCDYATLNEVNRIENTKRLRYTLSIRRLLPPELIKRVVKIII